jgi:hypothetical protein
MQESQTTPEARYLLMRSSPERDYGRSSPNHNTGRSGIPAIRRSDPPASLSLCPHQLPPASLSLCRHQWPPCWSDHHAWSILTNRNPLNGPSHLLRVSDTTDRIVDRRHAPPCAASSSSAAPTEHDPRASMMTSTPSLDPI